MAFFPCIHFCDAKVLMLRCQHIAQKNWSLTEKMRNNIKNEDLRHHFYQVLLKLVAICDTRKLRLIIENPWNTSRMTFLQTSFMPPQLIDRNRNLRGDYYVKPTAYWFIGCEHTNGLTLEKKCNPKIVYKEGDKNTKTGVCDSIRSLISPDYARNFICDFILGKPQVHSQLNLFDKP